MSKEERLYKLALKIQAKAPLKNGESELARGHQLAKINNTAYGYELTAKGERIAGGGV